MKNAIEWLKVGMIGILLISGIGGGLYSCYWVAKTMSYSFFYEDMVERTVTKMVKPEYLKGQ